MNQINPFTVNIEKGDETLLIVSAAALPIRSHGADLELGHLSN